MNYASMSKKELEQLVEYTDIGGWLKTFRMNKEMDRLKKNQRKGYKRLARVLGISKFVILPGVFYVAR